MEVARAMRSGVVIASLCAALGAGPGVSDAQTTVKFDLRGTTQVLRLYGQAGGEPVLVSSGDGGWMHLGPRVAELLAARGYSVVGLDSRAYLASFTSGRGALTQENEPGDFHELATFAARRGNGAKPLLIGVSEGAALSVLAATDSRTRDAVAGVVALGLGDVNELAWRWRDAIIYITHGVPNEPSFSVKAVVGRVAPLPLAVIQSTHDEFVPPSASSAIFAEAREPKRYWLVDAENHGFDGAAEAFTKALLEALAWARKPG
jgi:pimeloyl-ACP methyl ester carboxylesterase